VRARGSASFRDIAREREEDHEFFGAAGVRRGREMFVPLHHAPGHAQGDFGEALVVIGGVEQKAKA
jgi:hypothetical protein